MYQIWPRGTLIVKTLSDAITLHVLSAQYLIPGRENATSKSFTTKLIVNKSVDLFYNSVTRSFARRAIVVQTESYIVTQNCECDWGSNNTRVVSRLRDLPK